MPIEQWIDALGEALPFFAEINRLHMGVLRAQRDETRCRAVVRGRWGIDST